MEHKKITAMEGMLLTDGVIYGKEIYLSESDSENNYHEITEAEYRELLAEQEGRNG